MWPFRRRSGSPSGDTGVAVHADRTQEDALEAADRLAREQRYEDAMQLLTDANRRARDRRIERRLVELRHTAFRAASWPQVRPSWPSVPDRFPGVGIPEISADELSVEGLRSAITHHGALIVRGLVDADSVQRLVADIDNSLAAYDAEENLDDRSELAGWYQHFEPDRVSDRARKRFRGAVMTVESPPTLFDLIDTFERVGLGDLVRGYFGEPPMLLARKGTLRRMAHGGKTGGWHQDGAFMGADIRSLNIWLALTHCGDDAPGLDLVGRRLDGLVQTGEGAFADWATDPDVAEQAAAGAIERPIFDPGDVLLFDQLNLHRTAIDPGMDKDRYAIETWLFAPSTYELMTTEVADGYSPRDQLPIWF